MVSLPHSSCTMQCCSTGLLLARMTWKDMWGCHLKKPDADGDCCNCVHCDSLGSIVSASQMAAGKVLGKGQIPTASSQSTYYFPSCILVFFLFILVFFFPQMWSIKLAGILGVTWPLWENYICYSQHQSPKGTNILSIPPLLFYKGIAIHSYSYILIYVAT